MTMVSASVSTADVLITDMPLSNIRVLDLTRIISGPFCSALLADMGAEVIKVEPRETGDPVRAQGELKDGLSWYFANYNRNKKSITLDMYSQAGKDVYTAFALRMGLFIVVTLYACLMLRLLEPQPRTPRKPGFLHRYSPGRLKRSPP